MLAQGFVEEVKQLFDRGDLGLDKPSMRSVGYRQVWEYFLGQSTREEMRELAIFATRQFAKRQLTWLRNWSDAQWFEAEDKEVLYHHFHAYLSFPHVFSGNPSVLG
jgi:tRNA dimethylallyltransferase